MHITCQREALHAACQQVSSCIPSRSPKAILGCVKLATQGDDGLTMTAFDTEVGIRVELRGVVIKAHGAAVLPFTQFSNLLRECAEEIVEIKAEDTSGKLIAGKSKFSLVTQPADQFPELPHFDDEGRYHEITAGVLRAMIRRVMFAADKKDTGGRFALKGILWESEGTNARLVATDTKRLALADGPAVTYGPESKVKMTPLVPQKAMTLLERNLVDDGELVRVALQPSAALFQTEGAMIYTALVQGRYPPYRDIISMSRKNACVEVQIPTEEFRCAIRQAAIMSTDEIRRVDMVFGKPAPIEGEGMFSAAQPSTAEPGKGGQIKITTPANAENGSCDLEVPLAEYNGDEIKISFDTIYLSEFLKNADAETLTLELVNTNAPAIFRLGDGWQYLIQPLAE